MSKLRKLKMQAEARRRKLQPEKVTVPERVALVDGQEVPYIDVQARVEAEIAAIRLEEKLSATAYIPGVNFDEDDERAHGGSDKPVRFF